ncbi:hypothetical protein ACNPMX_11650 [Stenotrophomonas maltophilia]
MNLEQIDTSTTAGKAEVMRLAAEGRRVASRIRGEIQFLRADKPLWDWVVVEYAIISEPVGPEEVWISVRASDGCAMSRAIFNKPLDGEGVSHVRYIRADLAGEGK